MPLDTSIPLQVQSPQAPPVNFGQLLNLRESIALNREREMRVKEMERERNEDLAVIRAAGETNGDITKMAGMLQGKVNPERLLKLQNSYLENGRALATKTEAELKAIEQRHAAAGGLLEGIAQLPEDKRPAAWADAFEVARTHGLEPDKLGLTPEYPGTEKLQTLINLGRMSSGVLNFAKDLREEERKKAEETRKRDAAELKTQIDLAQEYRAQQDQDATLPGQRAKSETDELAVAAQKLAAAKSPEEYSTAWGDLPARVARTFPAPEQWKPELAGQIRSLGMTPAQQATDVRAQETGGNAGAPTEYRLAVQQAKGELGPNATEGAIAKRALEISREKPNSGEKPATRTQLAAVETRKQAALQKSQQQLAKDQREGMDPAEAWQAHRDRAQAAQDAFESELGVLTGKPMNHFEYPPAEEMRNGGRAQTTQTPQRATQESDAPPLDRLKDGIVTTFANGQKWTKQGGRAVRVP